jgi:hypothetical protein
VVFNKARIVSAQSESRRLAFARTAPLRFHMAGAIGAALAQRCFHLRWIKLVEDNRTLFITPTGLSILLASFAISRDQLCKPA